mmetsp:Transcript_71569/g.64253  ORF Transcript_71569/g.64253 Transcript_71569/m.64253 type:complete len:282 (-) Transcript_71569:309-1154(-)
MSLAISTAALSHLRPLVENIVDQNVKEIRRSSSYIGSPEEQKHLNYIADTMESSVQTATRALDCKDIVNSIKIKSGSNNPSLSSQLDELLRKQGEILQISASSLINSKRHYSQQYMPGGLDDNTTMNTNTGTTKCIELDDENINTPNDNDNDTPKCKDNIDNIEDDDDDKALNLQQIFNKLQLSVSNLTDNNQNNKTIKLNINKNSINDDQKYQDQDNDDNNGNNNNDCNASKWEMRRIWVKSMVLATHFITAVWLTLKDDVDGQSDVNNVNNGNNTNTPK